MVITQQGANPWDDPSVHCVERINMIDRKHCDIRRDFLDDKLYEFFHFFNSSKSQYDTLVEDVHFSVNFVDVLEPLH